MKSNRLKIFFLFYTIILLVNISKAQNLEIGAFVDTNIIEIGDQTYFYFQVKQPKNIFIQFPEISDKIIDGIEVLSKTGIDSINANDSWLLTQKYVITSFDDSIYTIPQFSFYIDTTAFKTDSFQIAVTLLDVDSSFYQKLDTTQTIPIFDIKEPINTPWTFKEFWEFNKNWILSTFFIALLLIIIVYVIVKRKQNKPIIKFEKPKDPAHVIALRNLEALKEKKLWQQDRIKEYYTELTDILREYIELRFNIPTFEKTSTEILRDVESAKVVDKDLILKLKEILTHSDLVKFAKGIPLAGDNDTNLQYAFNFVEKTIKQVGDVKLENDNNQDIQNNINSIDNE